MPISICPPPTDLECLFLGGLSEPEADAIEQHLQECPACDRKLADLLAAKDELSGMLSRESQSDGYGCRKPIRSTRIPTEAFFPIRSSRPGSERIWQPFGAAKKLIST